MGRNFLGEFEQRVLLAILRCDAKAYPIEIRRIMRRPERREVQADGRMRLWGYAASLSGYLRIVLLSDGETVHNAFYDEDY